MPNNRADIQSAVKVGNQSVTVTGRENGGAGDCFYLSVLERLKAVKFPGSSTITVQDLRNRAANYMLAHKEQYAPFLIGQTVDECAVKVKKPGEYADNPAIDALARSLNMQIVIVQTTPGLITKAGNDDAKEEVALLYLGDQEQHYRSLVAVDDLEKLGQICGAKEELSILLKKALAVDMPVKAESYQRINGIRPLLKWRDYISDKLSAGATRLRKIFGFGGRS